MLAHRGYLYTEETVHKETKMSNAEWKPVLVDGKLHPELHVGDRKMIYEIPDDQFDGDRRTLIGIATLCPLPVTGGDPVPYYWEFDGWKGHEITFGVQFTSHWADLPELPEGV